jgi:tetratricopeptide (TPR) repeat protein
MAERRQARPTAVAKGEAAVAAATALREAGDTSAEATGLRALALVLAYDPILTQRMFGPHPLARKRMEALQQAEELVLPWLLADPAAGLARAVQVEILLGRGEFRRGEAAVEALRRGLALIDELPEAERSRPGWRVTRARALIGLARLAVPEESGRLLEEARQEAAAVQRVRPDAAEPARTGFWVEHESAQRAMRTADPEAEQRHRLEAERRAFALHKRDPSSDDDWYLLLVARRALAETLVEQGRIGEAAAVLHRTAVDGGHPATQKAAVEGGSRRYIKGTLERIALLEAARGNFRMADLADEAQRSYVAALKVGPDGSLRAALSRDAVAAARIRTTLLLLRGDYAAAVELGETTLGQLRMLLAGPDAREADRVAYRGEVDEVTTLLAEALLHLGRPADAEARLNAAAELRPRNSPPYTTVQRTWLALALKRQKREEEARRALAPALRSLRGEEQTRTIRAPNRELLARAVLLEAVLQPDTEAGRARRLALQEETGRRLDAMTAETRELYAQRVLMRLRATEK